MILRWQEFCNGNRVDVVQVGEYCLDVVGVFHRVLCCVQCEVNVVGVLFSA